MADKIIPKPQSITPLTEKTEQALSDNKLTDAELGDLVTEYRSFDDGSQQEYLAWLKRDDWLYGETLLHIPLKMFSNIFSKIFRLGPDTVSRETWRNVLVSKMEGVTAGDGKQQSRAQMLASMVYFSDRIPEHQKTQTLEKWASYLEPLPKALVNALVASGLKIEAADLEEFDDSNAIRNFFLRLQYAPKNQSVRLGGVYVPSRHEIAVPAAATGKRTLIHESLHAYDRLVDHASGSEAFAEACRQDRQTLVQTFGEQSMVELFAHAGAAYFMGEVSLPTGNEPFDMASRAPRMHAYFQQLFSGMEG